jgi:hypothetical protein
VADYVPTDADRLAAHAVTLLATVSARNLASGDTFRVCVPRADLVALAEEVERQYPGWVAHAQAERAAR